jgi:hypothetical protein
MKKTRLYCRWRLPSRLPGEEGARKGVRTGGCACRAHVATTASLPFGRWSFLGLPTEVSAGRLRFTDPLAARAPLLFYRITCPDASAVNPSG